MPKGPGVNRWVYDFSCKNCAQLVEIHDGVRDGLYCRPVVEAVDRRPPDWSPFLSGDTMKPSDTNTIHADDDYHVRCNSYTPKESPDIAL